MNYYSGKLVQKICVESSACKISGDDEALMKY